MGFAAKTIRFDVSAAGTPAWAAQTADAVWASIANGSGSGNFGGAVISSVLPSPLPTVPGFNNNPPTIANNWTGGFFDADNGEYGFCACGGHADYAGNETYVLSIRSGTPAWRRIIDPTPSAVMQSANFNLEASTWPDGRSRAMHNSFQVWGDGFVWMPYQNSVTSGGGGSESIACSFNRASLGVALTPVAYSGGAGPWTFYGNIPITYDGSVLKFGTCCYDKVGKKVWASGGSGLNAPSMWSVSTAAATRGQMQGFQPPGSGFGVINAMASAHDLGIVLGFDPLANRFGYFNVANPGAGWVLPTNISGTQPTLGAIGSYSTPNNCVGAIYYQPQHSIIVCDPPRLGRQLSRLQIPVTSGGAFNPSGVWTWTTSTPAGPNFNITGGNAITYTKFALCEDIGNGQACLIYCGSIDGPTGIYKIPTTGFPF